MIDDTIQVANVSALDRPFLSSDLAWLELDSGHTVPLCASEFWVGPQGDLVVESGWAHFRVRSGTLEVVGAQGLVTTQGCSLDPGSMISPGDVVRVLDRSFQLVARPFTHLLQCLSPPFRDRIWPVGLQTLTTVGRKGSRFNDVELNEATVSRLHATIEVDPQGSLRILAEKPLHVNGQSLGVAERSPLADGDLLRLGDLLFCYTKSQTPKAQEVLRIHSLGGLQVFVVGARCTSPQWVKQKVRFLFVYIAFEWPRPVAVDALLDAFWPEMDAHNARNNLRGSLSRLRAMLAVPSAGGAPDLFERTTQTVAIHPGVSLWHDVADLRRLVSEGSIPQALELYRGRFLEDCDMDWARKRADLLQNALQDAAQGYVQAAGNERERRKVSERWLEIDPTSQWACGAVMASLRKEESFSAALAFFQRFEKELAESTGLEPTTELLRERQLALMESSD